MHTYPRCFTSCTKATYCTVSLSSLFTFLHMELPDHSRGYGVEPVPLNSIDIKPPFCPHGPTLLFERYYAHKEPRSFFACSVHRNRKGCSFFHWADEPISDEKRQRWMAVFKESQPVLNRSELQSTLQAIKSLPPNQRYYCSQCGVLFTESALDSHSTHSYVKGVADESITKPTRLLAPVDNRKSQAQFYFSDTSLQLLVSELTRLEFAHVLCVGTPRLHEALLSSGLVNSLLLDIDHRYAQFFPVDNYQRFNMFTSYFHEETGKAICERFITGSAEKVAIVVDPPFGGLAKVLAVGIEDLWKLAKRELPTFLVFPYFMESHVLSALPSLWMMDYQVTYDNHKHFCEDHKSSKPSPVRIYTNVPRPGLELPAAEGYHLCAPCNRYVARGNVHCETCGNCTSKDGRSYRHCFECQECVKPGRVHCSVCSRCELPEHKCGSRPNVGCHVCGSLEHKRRDCPQKSQSTDNTKQQRKRKSEFSYDNTYRKHKGGFKKCPTKRHKQNDQ